MGLSPAPLRRTGRRRTTTRAGGGGPGRPPVAEGELTHLLRVAQRLDGLPLALELAAARLRLFSAAQLADRLDDLLGTLDAGGPNTAEYPVVSVGRHRHSTLRATVDWSYRTLPKEAASLLRQLCVFAGQLDLETVEWVAGAGAVDQLAVLVGKSLVVAEPGQRRRTSPTASSTRSRPSPSAAGRGGGGGHRARPAPGLGAARARPRKHGRRRQASDTVDVPA